MLEPIRRGKAIRNVRFPSEEIRLCGNHPRSVVGGQGRRRRVVRGQGHLLDAAHRNDRAAEVFIRRDHERCRHAAEGERPPEFRGNEPPGEMPADNRHGKPNQMLLRTRFQGVRNQTGVHLCG